MKNRPLLMPAVALLLLGMTACSLVDPIVVRGIDACDPVATGKSGEGCAAALRDRYLDAVGDRERLSTLTNAGLLTLVTTFGVLAGFDKVDAETILAGGIGGAALLAAPRAFGTDQRDFIYLAGAEAMSCVLDAGLPAIRLQSDTVFHTEHEKARAAVKASIDKLQGASLALGEAENSAIGRALADTLAEASALYLDSLKLKRNLGHADARVLNAARSIDVQVNTALVQQRTDPAALVTALSGSTMLVQGQISSFLPALVTPQGEDDPNAVKTSAPETKKAVAEARMHVLTLRAITQQINEVLSPFADSSLRRRCTIDSPDIRPFSADPRRIVMTAPENGETGSATIVVTGGKAPHRARFVGVQPAPADSLVSSVEETEDGAATIRVTATSAVRNGTYTLRLESKDGKTFPVSVAVASAEGRKAEDNRNEDEEKDRPNGNPSVAALQDRLAEIAKCKLKDSTLEVLGAVQEKVNPGEIDGVLGDDTKAAIGNLLSIALPEDSSTQPGWDDMEGTLDEKANAVLKRADDVAAAICQARKSNGSDSG